MKIYNLAKNIKIEIKTRKIDKNYKIFKIKFKYIFKI